jgi:hypothetical protein
MKDYIMNTFSGIQVNVRLLNNTVIPTYAIFTNGEAKNIDTRQSPTLTTGEVARMALVPAIDFINQTTNAVTTPQVGGSVEWMQLGVSYKKSIMSVVVTSPQQGTPIMFTLGVA